MLDFAQARRTMVDSQLRTFDVTDRAVLAAMGELARERFVPPGREELAYSDRATLLRGPREDGGPRYMLPPMVVGRMVQALRVEASSDVLDVGCGLGYSSAVLERLGARVTALENNPSLADAARERLTASAPGVSVREGPLTDGWADTGPYRSILVNGSVGRAPDRLLRQLGDGGRLVCVLGGGRSGKAVLYLRSGETIGSNILFDAQVPDLREFQPEPSFEF